MNLVVKQIEAVRRFRLRLAIQLPLKGPDTLWCCQAHRQSPILVSVRSTPEVRALPFAGITRPQRYHDPVRLPPGPPPIAALETQPPPAAGIPRLPGSPFRRAVPTYPGGSRQVLVSVACLSHAAFPVSQPGRHPHLHFRDPMTCCGWRLIPHQKSEESLPSIFGADHERRG
jgi:hypothetical protein